MWFLFDIVKSYVSVGFAILVLAAFILVGECVVNEVRPFIGE